MNYIITLIVNWYNNVDKVELLNIIWLLICIEILFIILIKSLYYNSVKRFKYKDCSYFDNDSGWGFCEYYSGSKCCCDIDCDYKKKHPR